MKDDPVRGRAIRWSYEDGPVKGKTFEHAFAPEGTVTYREIAAGAPGPSKPLAYEVSRIDRDVYAVSYLATSGFTLTTVVHEPSGRIVSFASNETTLVVQHGSIVPD